MKSHLLFTPALSLAAAAALLCGPVNCHAANPWSAWPDGQNPKDIGTKLVQNLLGRKMDAGRGGLTYLETCAGFGAVRFAEDAGDADLLSKVMTRYQGIITADGTGLLPKPTHVDQSVFGILPLQMYKVTGNAAYLKLGLSYADSQNSAMNADGVSTQNRYQLDEPYKISTLQGMAFDATQKADYADHAVKELSVFIDKLQQPSGLYFHSIDAHVFWGRGDGWVFAGLTETLKLLPPNQAGRDKLVASYKAMAAELLKVQAPDGRWRQVLDDDKAWEENSCTGYFIFGLAEGVNQGWLDAATYQPAIKKAWGALCGQLDATANVQDVGVLTEHSNDESYYLARPKQAGNLHGQFAAIWAATALMGN